MRASANPYSVNGSSMNTTNLESVQVHRKNSRPVRVRELAFSDYRDIKALESRYALETKSYEEWTHLWDANPAYQGIAPAWPRGWVLENEDNLVVGYLANIPLWYELEGQKVIVAASHAWVVDSRYRKYSILLLNNCFNQQNVDVYLSTSSNRQSCGILAMFNSRVPVGAWDESLFWITDYRGFASSWIAMKAAPSLRPLTYALSGALFLRDLSAGNVLPATRIGVEVEFHEAFDERFDVFWENLRRQKSQFFLAVRSREVLQWHFKYALLRNEVWILTIADGSDLAAYAIFCRQDNAKFGLERMRLVDFQVLNGDTALLLPMLRCALLKCREQGIHMLEYIGVGPEVREVLATLRPHRRKLPSWLYYYAAANENLASRLKNPEIWNPSCFDGDSSL
jgi:hypothetical protein